MTLKYRFQELYKLLSPDLKKVFVARLGSSAVWDCVSQNVLKIMRKKSDSRGLEIEAYRAACDILGFGYDRLMHTDDPLTMQEVSGFIERMYEDVLTKKYGMAA